MAEMKTKETKASVQKFLKGIKDDDRRRDCTALVELMKEVTQAQPRMWGTSIVGFGSYHYKYASGREGDWFIVGFSPRKQDLTLYLLPGLAGRETLLSKLGKHRTGRSCLYVKRLADVDPVVLRQLVERSVKEMAAFRSRQ